MAREAEAWSSRLRRTERRWRNVKPWTRSGQSGRGGGRGRGGSVSWDARGTEREELEGNVWKNVIKIMTRRDDHGEDEEEGLRSTSRTPDWLLLLNKTIYYVKINLSSSIINYRNHLIFHIIRQAEINYSRFTIKMQLNDIWELWGEKRDRISPSGRNKFLWW